MRSQQHPVLRRRPLTHVGVFGGGQAAVRSLGAPQAELQQSDVLPSRHPVARRVGRHQTGGHTRRTTAGHGQVRSPFTRHQGCQMQQVGRHGAVGERGGNTPVQQWWTVFGSAAVN